LTGGDPTAEAGPFEPVHWLPVELVAPGAQQARTHFDEAALRELAASIREQGLLQPVVVRPVGERYELIAGERRWRACRLLGMERIPALVRDLTDERALEAGLVENLQREDISVVDEAHAYRQLIERFGYTQGRIAQRTGRHRASISNIVRLLQLPGPVLDLLHAGEITEGHARALLALPDAAEQTEMAEWIARNAVSVRDTERRVAQVLDPQASGDAAPPTAPDAYVRALEDRLRGHFGTRVRLDYRRGRGSLLLEFYSDDDLERILDLLRLPG
jgi:ParB family chromosome partitioning protein